MWGDKCDGEVRVASGAQMDRVDKIGKLGQQSCKGSEFQILCNRAELQQLVSWRSMSQEQMQGPMIDGKDDDNDLKTWRSIKAAVAEVRTGQIIHIVSMPHCVGLTVFSASLLLQARVN